ncbi:hypothetical protein Tco_0557774, partial [Tanacetum coccineum]
MLTATKVGGLKNAFDAAGDDGAGKNAHSLEK